MKQHLPACLLSLILSFTVATNLFAQKNVDDPRLFNHRIDQSIVPANSICTTRYTLTTSTGSYVNMSGGTQLNSGTWDDPVYSSIPIGFSFTFFDQSYTVTDVWDGAVSFVDQGTGFDNAMMIPYGCDMMDRGYKKR